MIKLDLGAGEVSPEGFMPLGHRFRTEIFPLAYADASVDEIRASHVLEHFPVQTVPEVLRDWVRALKPGGRLRAAVPDFAQIARNYLAGADEPTCGYVMGGQTAPDDFHKSLFDAGSLKQAMSDAGLVLLRPWRSEIEDCAALPVSLNFEGRKPHVRSLAVRGLMSAGRWGSNTMWNCAASVFPQLNVPFRRITGAYWDITLTAGMQSLLEEPGADYIMTADHDSVFHSRAAADLIQLAMVYPEVDAIAPVQASRHHDGPLFSLANEVPTTQYGDTVTVPLDVMSRDLVPARTAHFGLTLIKVSKLRELKKPWFVSTPDGNGEWGQNATHADMHFWRQWLTCGFSLMVAPKVVIGHQVEMIMWPGPDMKPVYQTSAEWESTRCPPPGAWTGEWP